LISPDSILENPLHIFVKDCLIPVEDKEIKLGSRDNNNDTLYGVYLL
jgi:hypothetical protein